MYEMKEQVEPQRHLAVKRFTAAPDQIGPLVGEAFGAVYHFVGRHGLTPVGAPIACYVMGNGQDFDIRAGCEVGVPIQPEGDIEPYLLPGGPSLTTEHIGPYDELPKAYEALQAHAREAGRDLDMTVMWEEYLTGPEVPPDQTRTVIHWPLKA